MTKIRVKFFCMFCIALLIGSSASMTGCDNAPAETPDTDAQTANRKIPKLDFYRPDDLKLAVKRLNELHDAMTADGDLPAPLVYKVVETVHGNHSHYNLAGDEYEGHHEDGEKEVLHDYEVDPFTEMVDIARWLPKTAGEGDLEKEDWNSVNKLSVKLEKQLNELFNDSSAEKKRSAYRAESASVKEMIGELDKLASKDD